AAALEPFEPLDHLAQARHLPGHLVDRELGVLAVVRIHLRHHPAREEHERMVVATVAREVADARPVLAALALGKTQAEVDRVGYPEAQDPAVEIARGLG